MRHGKKKKLTSQDMERALKWYDAPPTLGHQCNQTEQKYIQAPDANRPQETLFAPDEALVDLYDYSLSMDSLQEEEHHDVAAAGLKCEASWVAVEGNSIDDLQGHDPNAIPLSKIDYPQPTDLSQPLLQYYTALVSVILSDSNHELRKTIVDDVQTNSKIGPIVPFLVTFIRNGMERNSDNPVLLIRFLALLEAIFINPYINLSPKPYVSTMNFLKEINRCVSDYSSFNYS